MTVKKSGFLMLVFLLVIGVMAACSSSSSSEEGNTDESTDSGSEEASSENNDSDSITIGAIFPLTGPGAPYADIFKQGTEFALEEINASGGVDGKQLEIDYIDGQADPKVSATAMQDVAAKGYSFALSSYTGGTLSVLPIAERNDIAVINGGGQGIELAGASPNLFNTIPLIDLEIKVLAQYLGEETDLKTAYTVYVDDDSGRPALDVFTEEFAKYGGEVVGSGSHAMGETNFRSILIDAKSKNPDILYIASHGQDAKIIVDQAKEIGLDAQIVNTSWTLIPEIIESPNGQGIITTSLAIDPSEEWMTKFEEKFGTTEVNSYVINYYDAVKVFKTAYEYAVENDYGTDGNAIIKAINEIKDFESDTGKLTFNEDGTSVRDVNIATIKDQKTEVIKSY